MGATDSTATCQLRSRCFSTQQSWSRLARATVKAARVPMRPLTSESPKDNSFLANSPKENSNYDAKSRLGECNMLRAQPRATHRALRTTHRAKRAAASAHALMDRYSVRTTSTVDCRHAPLTD